MGDPRKESANAPPDLELLTRKIAKCDRLLKKKGAGHTDAIKLKKKRAEYVGQLGEIAYRAAHAVLSPVNNNNNNNNNNMEVSGLETMMASPKAVTEAIDASKFDDSLAVFDYSTTNFDMEASETKDDGDGDGDDGEEMNLDRRDVKPDTVQEQEHAATATVAESTDEGEDIHDADDKDHSEPPSMGDLLQRLSTEDVASLEFVDDDPPPESESEIAYSARDSSTGGYEIDSEEEEVGGHSTTHPTAVLAREEPSNTEEDPPVIVPPATNDEPNKDDDDPSEVNDAIDEEELQAWIPEEENMALEREENATASPEPISEYEVLAPFERPTWTLVQAVPALPAEDSGEDDNDDNDDNESWTEEQATGLPSLVPSDHKPTAIDDDDDDGDDDDNESLTEEEATGELSPLPTYKPKALLANNNSNNNNNNNNNNNKQTSGDGNFDGDGSVSKLRAMFDSPAGGEDTEKPRRSWKPRKIVKQIPPANLEDSDHSSSHQTNNKSPTVTTKVVVPGGVDSIRQAAMTSSVHDIEGKIVALVSLFPESLFDHLPKQGRVMTIFKGNGIEPIYVDGSDPDEKQRRNELFELSGKRGVYPQLFVQKESTGQLEFFADFDKIELLNDCQTLVEALEAAQR